MAGLTAICAASVMGRSRGIFIWGPSKYDRRAIGCYSTQERRIHLGTLADMFAAP